MQHRRPIRRIPFNQGLYEALRSELYASTAGITRSAGAIRESVAVVKNVSRTSSEMRNDWKGVGLHLGRLHLGRCRKIEREQRKED